MLSAKVEFIFTDHIYTATVHDIHSFERFFLDCDSRNRAFRFGSVDARGFDSSALLGSMNRAKSLNAYDHDGTRTRVQ